jgi:TetR/AcrR family transcriptional repressor of multidrug resistance operon
MRKRDINKEITIHRKAVEMVVSMGFDGFSMKKLAKAANISVSTIYIYFKNKEDLINRLFIEIEQKFEEDALKKFDPGMSFESGLWLQWKNRYKNIVKDPLSFYFFEQFRNSPLIKHKDIKQNVFRKKMNEFVKNAISKKEVVDLPIDIFWAIAYGAFYTLIKFHLDKATMAGKPFLLNEHKMKQAFDHVIKSLKP